MCVCAIFDIYVDRDCTAEQSQQRYEDYLARFHGDRILAEFERVKDTKEYVVGEIIIQNIELAFPEQIQCICMRRGLEIKFLFTWQISNL